MANRFFSNVQALNKEVKILAGTFLVQSDGLLSRQTGLGYRVESQPDVGTYKLILDDQYPSILSAIVSAEIGGIQNINAVVRSVDQLNDCVTIQLMNGNTPIKPTVDVKIHVVLICQNTSMYIV